MPYPQIKAPIQCWGTKKGGFVILLFPLFFFEREREKEKGRRKEHGDDITARMSLTKPLEELWDKSESFLLKWMKMATWRPLGRLEGAPWGSLAETQPALRKENNHTWSKGREAEPPKMLMELWKEAGRCWGTRRTQKHCAALIAETQERQNRQHQKWFFSRAASLSWGTAGRQKRLINLPMGSWGARLGSDIEWVLFHAAEGPERQAGNECGLNVTGNATRQYAQGGKTGCWTT